MKTYNLILTADDGTVLNTWLVGDADDEGADIIYPIVKMGPADLAHEVNRAISQAGGI